MREFDPSGFKHLCRRHGSMTRRRFLGGGVALGAAVVGSGLVDPRSAFADGLGRGGRAGQATPRPIPNGFTINNTTFHVFGPADDLTPQSPELATVNDFKGFEGAAFVQGTGTGTNPDGSTEPLLFDCDMRFQKGVYVGTDNRVHEGTFGFV
jgi:hypothetical protein